MNPQQVRANDSRSWIPRLGNLGQRVGTVVSSEGPRCRTPSTQQFVDSFVLHYRGEYRKRKRGRGREGGRQNAGEIGERRYIYIYRSTRADIRTSFSIRNRKWLRANWRALCAPPPPSGSSASGPAIRRIACHRPRARRILLGKIGPLCWNKGTPPVRGLLRLDPVIFHEPDDASDAQRSLSPPLRGTKKKVQAPFDP